MKVVSPLGRLLMESRECGRCLNSSIEGSNEDIRRISQELREVKLRLVKMEEGLGLVAEGSVRIREKTEDLERSLRGLEERSEVFQRRMEDEMGRTGLAVVKRSNTVPQEEATKYKVSFRVQKEADGKEEDIAKHTMEAEDDDVADKNHLGIPVPNKKTRSLGDIYAKEEDAGEEMDSEVSHSMDRIENMSERLLLPPLSAANRCKSIGDVSSSAAARDASESPPPTEETASQSSPSNVAKRPPRSPFSSFKRNKMTSSMPHAISSQTLDRLHQIPLRSKSLKDDAKHSRKRQTQRLSLNSTDTATASGSETPTKLRGSWNSLYGSFSDLAHHHHHNQDSVSLDEASDVPAISAPSKDVTFIQLELSSFPGDGSPGDCGVVKCGNLELKKSSGFKSYKTYWCCLFREEENNNRTIFYIFPAACGQGEKNLKPKQAWDLSVCTMKKVSADGKEFKRSDKRSKYFQLIPKSDDPSSARQFQASSKEDAESWTSLLQTMTMRSARRSRPHSLLSLQEVMAANGVMEMVATPVDSHVGLEAMSPFLVTETLLFPGSGR